MEIIDGFIEVFFGAVGFFDFKSVEGFGMDDAFDFFAGIDDGEIGEAGLVELVQSEGAKYFCFTNKNHFGLWNH